MVRTQEAEAVTAAEEKGDITRDMVKQPEDPEIPRKPGISRIDKTISAAEDSTKSEDDTAYD